MNGKNSLKILSSSPITKLVLRGKQVNDNNNNNSNKSWEQQTIHNIERLFAHCNAQSNSEVSSSYIWRAKDHLFLLGLPSYEAGNIRFAMFASDSPSY